MPLTGQSPAPRRGEPPGSSTAIACLVCCRAHQGAARKHGGSTMRRRRSAGLATIASAARFGRPTCSARTRRRRSKPSGGPSSRGAGRLAFGFASALPNFSKVPPPGGRTGAGRIFRSSCSRAGRRNGGTRRRRFASLKARASSIPEASATAAGQRRARKKVVIQPFPLAEAAPYILGRLERDGQRARKMLILSS